VAKRRIIRTTAGAGTALGATVLFAPAAEAATFTVTTLADTDDGALCDADCSLREAAAATNTTAGADEIVFASGLTGTIALTDDDGEIPLRESVTVTGPGADVLTVSGNDSSRIFYANTTVHGAPYDPVSISGLTLTRAFDGGRGGAVYARFTNVTLDGLVITDNYGGGGGGVYSGGGQFAVTNSVFDGNDANGGGGALYVLGTEGTPADDIEVLIADSSFTGNYSDGYGGGAMIDAEGDVVVERSTFTGNRTPDDGGGLNVDNLEGSLTIRDSTFSGNTAQDAGGIAIDSISDAALIENTTVSGNRAEYNGGGVYFDFSVGEQAIRNSTIVGNAATYGPAATGAEFYGGGGIYVSDIADDAYVNGPIGLSSTIVAGNSARLGPDLLQGPYAEPSSAGFSLIQNPAGATIAESPAGSNLTGADPLLGPLAENGGPTQTHLPAIGSPALDAGIANGLASEQRGEARTFDASNLANRPGADGTDIGATELTTEGTCKGKAATVLFAPGQKISGSAGKDVIVGTAQKDKIDAKGGKDTVCAGAGNDRVKGGGGKDNLSGQGGKDTLKGGGGRDKLSGGAGKDKLRGGPGKDKLKGGGGKDSEVQ
jgi:CSLREA domain-containing protein